MWMVPSESGTAVSCHWCVRNWHRCFPPNITRTLVFSGTRCIYFFALPRRRRKFAPYLFHLLYKFFTLA